MGQEQGREDAVKLTAIPGRTSGGNNVAWTTAGPGTARPLVRLLRRLRPGEGERQAGDEPVPADHQDAVFVPEDFHDRRAGGGERSPGCAGFGVVEEYRAGLGPGAEQGLAVRRLGTKDSERGDLKSTLYGSYFPLSGSTLPQYPSNASP